MSINELNSTARDLMSVRQMIEQLEAEAEVLQGDGWEAAWKNVNSSRFGQQGVQG